MKSMTGYGRARQMLHSRDITVELRSVNHRYLDVNVKAPRMYGFLEEAVKTAVSQMIARGKVDIFITIDASASDDVKISLNRKLLENYLELLHEMRDAYHMQDDVSVMAASRLPDVFTTEKQEADADELTADVLQVLQAAGADFCEMRAREGEKMKEDVLSREQTILRYVTEIEKRSPQAVAEYRAKLTELDTTGDFLLSAVRSAPVRAAKPEEAVETEALLRALKTGFDEYLGMNPRLAKDVVFTIVSSDDPMFLTEYMPANLLFRYEDKQAVMNENTLNGRMQRLVEMLRRECQVMKIEKEIAEKVNESMDKN